MYLYAGSGEAFGMVNRIRVDSPIGPLTVSEENGALTQVLFGAHEEAGEKVPVLAEAERQLREYFSGTRREFDLPLNPSGTEFQKAVWRALQAIPCGETRSYAEIARAVNRPRAFRAVGMANHCNPIPVIIPCHRVVGANGALTGYAGGLPFKEFLLRLEGSLR